MAHAKLPPFIVWRDGRPRFIPGARERALGFKGEDLRHDGGEGPRTGEWLTFEQARSWGNAKHVAVLAARVSGQRIRKPAAPKGRTVEHLLGDWIATMARACAAAIQKGERPPLSAESLKSYRDKIAAVVHAPETRADAKLRRQKTAAAELLGQPAPERAKEPFATTQISAIGKPELRGFFDYARDARGHTMALGMIAAISAAWTWGCDQPFWRLPTNPRLDMSFDRPAGRVMLIPLDEFLHIVTAADLIGRGSIGDSFYLGLFTGQRQTDRLALADNGLVDGRRQFEQSKTGVRVNIKETPQLAARLEAARVRIGAIALRLGLRPEARPKTIVVDETTGRPYVGSSYRHAYADVRRAAVHGIVRIDGAPTIADPAELGYTPSRTGNTEWLLPPLAACADKRDQDLRDTCVILLRVSGTDALGICDITGHSYQSIQTIIEHYLGRDATRADAAIDKLAAFVAAKGSGV